MTTPETCDKCVLDSNSMKVFLCPLHRAAGRWKSGRNRLLDAVKLAASFHHYEYSGSTCKNVIQDSDNELCMYCEVIKEAEHEPNRPQPRT